MFPTNFRKNRENYGFSNIRSMTKIFYTSRRFICKLARLSSMPGTKVMGQNVQALFIVSLDPEILDAMGDHSLSWRIGAL